MLQEIIIPPLLGLFFEGLLGCGMTFSTGISTGIVSFFSPSKIKKSYLNHISIFLH